MTIVRRLERLEAAQPENSMSFRVLFKHDGEPDPVVDPPLGSNERLIMVNYVDPRR
jgi:hypothetical protein